ncbi:hypothetical protein Glove_74g94 [Diversispora epigaea]|uniref:C2H2-type domain-containing protein n=1 Tax=Diversispora epigaea TaxID=1348612 RepID=A0A397J9F2_9GLOM|nr:hypothetical protein Glove_74g94 [Diversispora epigaea]
MSTSYKCPYCNICYFSNRNSYSQHVNRCINLYNVSTEESNTEVSEVTDMLLDNDDFNHIEERQSVQEIENLPSGSEITDLFEYGDYDADASVSLEVISNIPEHFEEILFESSRNEDSDVENLQNEDSNIEHLQNEDLDVRSESSRNEDSDVEEFPNESYADLMTLVTKYNLNNKAGNAIIKFFNKHSNLSISPLPKNIETGRKYMDKMNLSRLLYYKHHILVHNNKEYFINYQPVIKCIENLLSNPKISQLFVYNYKKLENEDLDVRSESSRNEDSDVEEFPNESYADLMTLVTKYNLNNKAGNAIIKFFNKHSNLSISPLPKNIETGRKYMDKMNLSRLLYYKHHILVHNNKEYFINYQPVIKCIENLLSNPKISQLFVYNYKKLEIENKQLYGKQYIGNWWKKVKESIPSVAYILSIILYSDATTTDTLVRETFHNSIKFLLDSLFTNDDDDGDGIELKIDNEIFWFFPRVSTIICDWPEACTFSLTYKSTNSNYPCHFCLVSKENLNNTRLRDDQMVLRNKENMLQYYNNGTTEKASLKPVFNYF